MEALRKGLLGLLGLLRLLGLLPQPEIHYIGGSDTLPPPLSREREAELLARLTDEDARKELIEHNLRLVVYIARRFENTGINIEDLISIGTIGLIKAVGTYRADKNIKLATYASRCIENEILMYLRKNANRKGEVSFDEPLNTDWDGNELLLSDVLGTEEDTVMRPIEEDVERSLLAAAINALSPREKQIITLRFGLGGGREQTQKEVADQLGISQSYISRLEKRIISRLKKEILRMSCTGCKVLAISSRILYNITLCKKPAVRKGGNTHGRGHQDHPGGGGGGPQLHPRVYRGGHRPRRTVRGDDRPHPFPAGAQRLSPHRPLQGADY